MNPVFPAGSRSASIYKRQKEFYKSAYEQDFTPWSGGAVDPFVQGFIERVSTGVKRGFALDLGCGDGRHSRSLSKSGFKVVGLDYQPLALGKALSATPAGIRPKIVYVCGDFFNPPLGAFQFDLVLDYGIFHHIRRKDTPHYLGFIRGMLKPGGFLILSCFSVHFKHHDLEVRTRNFLVHRNHYDRFSTRGELRSIFSEDFRILGLREERNGNNGFFHLLMQKKPGRP